MNDFDRDSLQRRDIETDIKKERKKRQTEKRKDVDRTLCER